MPGAAGTAPSPEDGAWAPEELGMDPTGPTNSSIPLPCLSFPVLGRQNALRGTLHGHHARLTQSKVLGDPSALKQGGWLLVCVLPTRPISSRTCCSHPN